VPRLIWTPSALRDVGRLYDFLAPKSRQAAERAIRVIRQGVKTLARHPHIGHPVEEMSPEFRRWFIEFGDNGYIVLYRFEDDRGVILAVRHAREAGF